jgi:3-isopropylmalate dehydrogenase
MLRYLFGYEAEAKTIENAMDKAITEGARTADPGGKLSTVEMADEVIGRV